MLKCYTFSRVCSSWGHTRASWPFCKALPERLFPFFLSLQQTCLAQNTLVFSYLTVWSFVLCVAVGLWREVYKTLPVGTCFFSCAGVNWRVLNAVLEQICPVPMFKKKKEKAKEISDLFGCCSCLTWSTLPPAVLLSVQCLQSSF